jgi:ornithine cyclodeaminase/alanine dehydrogenase-like protein (mu-crystallin family)
MTSMRTALVAAIAVVDRLEQAVEIVGTVGAPGLSSGNLVLVV